MLATVATYHANSHIRGLIVRQSLRYGVMFQTGCERKTCTRIFLAYGSGYAGLGNENVLTI